MNKILQLIGIIVFAPNAVSLQAQIWDYYDIVTFPTLFKQNYVAQNKVKSCRTTYYHVKDSAVKTAYTDAVYEFNINGQISKISWYKNYADSLAEEMIYFYNSKGQLTKRICKDFERPDHSGTEKYIYRKGLLTSMVRRIDKTHELDYIYKRYYDKQNRLIFEKDTFTGNYCIYRYDEVGYGYMYWITDDDFPHKQLVNVKSIKDLNAFSSIFERDKDKYEKYKDGRLIEDAYLKEYYYYRDDGRIDYTAGKYGRNEEKVEYENKLPIKMTYCAYPGYTEFEIYVFTYTYY